jgi:ABC-type bacteriocin/lantibiotic exporter with double-glycine peptidase domain
VTYKKALACRLVDSCNFSTYDSYICSWLTTLYFFHPLIRSLSFMQIFLFHLGLIGSLLSQVINTPPSVVRRKLNLLELIGNGHIIYFVFLISYQILNIVAWISMRYALQLNAWGQGRFFFFFCGSCCWFVFFLSNNDLLRIIDIK